MKVSTIITAVRTVLLDNFSYGDSSYSDPELIGFYNRACNFCVDLSSTCNPVTKVVSLVAGVSQKIPPSGGRINGFLHNDLTTSFKAGIMTYKAKHSPKEIDYSALIRQIPGFASEKPSAGVAHVCYDQSSPKDFVVYPPNDGTGKLVVRYTEYPAPAATLNDEIVLGSDYHEAIINYTLYLCLTRDGQDTANSARADAFFKTASMALQGSDAIKYAFSAKPTLRA